MKSLRDIQTGLGIFREIKIADQTITESLEIAEELTIGEKLSSETPSFDIEPETYLTPT